MAKTTEEYSKLTVEAVLRELRVDAGTGLNAKDVTERLAQYGWNEIPEKEEPLFHRIIRRFWGPIPWMIEVAALLSALANQSASYVLTDQIPRAMGNGHASIAPYDTYPTGDGTLVLAVGNDKQFAQLCDALGISGLAQDDRFRTNELRVRNRAPLREQLERALASNSAAYWSKALPALGVPAGAVNNIAEAFALAEELGLQPIRTTEDGDIRFGAQVASPINLSTTPVSYRTRAPLLGEHSAEIRSWLTRRRWLPKKYQALSELAG